MVETEMCGEWDGGVEEKMGKAWAEGAGTGREGNGKGGKVDDGKVEHGGHVI